MPSRARPWADLGKPLFEDGKKNIGIDHGVACPEPPAAEAVPPRGRGMDLTRGSIPVVLLLFSAPIIGQMAIQPLFGILDRVFIAQLGPEAFSAVVNAANLQMFIIMMATGLATGVTSYVARLIGKGEYNEADNAAMHAIILMAILSISATVILLPLNRHYFRVLKMDESMIETAHDFIKIILVGNVTIMFSLIGANILRGEGNSVAPFVLAVISLSINLVLAPLLIFGPEDRIFGLHLGWLGMGVMGGALATVIGRGVGCVLLIFYLKRGKTNWTLSFCNYHWHPRHVIEILRVGVPMMGRNMSAWFATMIFLRVLNQYEGATAAYGMGAQLDMLAVLPMIGLMLGVVSMVGQNYGAGNLSRAKRSAWTGGFFAAVFSGAMGMVFICFPEFFIGLFNRTEDPVLYQVISGYGLEYIGIVGFTYVFVSQVFVLGGAFQGLGKGLPPLIITLARFIFVAIPLVTVLHHSIGPAGAWVAIASSHVVGGVFAVAWVWWEFKKREKEAED